jgi:hypothetical protein
MTDREFFAQFIATLERMATDARFDDLAYFLHLAALEAAP